jgi:hypothetical protein
MGASIVALCVCSTGSDLDPELFAERELDRTLARIDITDGIQLHEAAAIMDAYRWMTLSGCGSTEEPTWGDGVWRSRAWLGYAGVLLPGAIEVDARTGAVGYPGCPGFQTLARFRAGWREPGGETSWDPPCWAESRPAG